MSREISANSNDQLLYQIKTQFQLPKLIRGKQRSWTVDLDYTDLSVKGPKSIGPLSQGTLGITAAYPVPPFEFKIYGGYWNNFSDHVLRWFLRFGGFKKVTLTEDLPGYSLYSNHDHNLVKELFESERIVRALNDLEGLDMELNSEGKLACFEPVRSNCVSYDSVKSLIELQELILPEIESREFRSA